MTRILTGIFDPPQSGSARRPAAADVVDPFLVEVPPVWLLAIVLLLPDPSDSVKVTPPTPAESLHVVAVGAGDPVVLVPGLFGSVFGFRKLIPLLVQASHRVIVVEPLGIGSSARPEHADYSLGAQTDRVATVLDTLAVRDAIVVGHSIGGALGFRLAYRRPDLVGALVSLEGGPTESAVTPAFRRAMRFAPWIRLLGGVKLVRRIIRRSLISSSGDTTWITEAVVRGYTAGAARDLDGTLKAYISMAGAREGETLRPHLAGIHCPVLLMVGGAPHDGDVGGAEIDLLRRTLPAFTLDSVPRAGHFLYEERPDAVVEAVAEARRSPR